MGLRPVALLALALAIAPGGSAQEAVRSARMVADLTAGDGSAAVRIEYRLSGAYGEAGVAARVLDFGGAAVEWVRVGEDARELAVTRGPGLARTVALPIHTTGDRQSLSLSYEVPRAASPGGGALRGHVPVLTLDRPPEATRPGLFTAELRTPPEWILLEGFPTGFRATGEPGVYRAELQVVPSVVSFRVRPDGTWRPGLHHLLDAFALAMLLGFGLVGWRHLGRAEP